MRFGLLAVLTLAWIPLHPLPTGAATITIYADQSLYAPGDTVILTIVGDGQGASASDVFVRLLLERGGSGASLQIDALNQTTGGIVCPPDSLFTSTVTFTYQGGVNTVSVDEIDFFGLTTADVATATFGIAEPQLPLQAPLTQIQEPMTSFGGALPWTPGPLTYAFVPEPASGLLLGLGLAGLGAARPRSRSRAS